MIEILNYINGELTPALSGSKLDNISPRDGKVFSSITDSNADDVEKAVAAAQVAFPKWKTTSSEDLSLIHI